MSGHTPGPWRVSFRTVVADTDASLNMPIAEAFSRDNRELSDTERFANAARIVACVNACEGIDPEAVPDLLKALEGILALADDAEYIANWCAEVDAVCAALARARGGK